MQIDVHILFRIKPKYSSRHAGLCCSRNTPGTIILPRGLCTCCLLFWPLKTLSLNSHPFPGEQLSHPPILSSAVPTSRKPSLTPKSESGVPFVQVEPPQAIPSRSCPLSLSLYRNGSALPWTEPHEGSTGAIWSPVCPQHYPAQGQT